MKFTVAAVATVMVICAVAAGGAEAAFCHGHPSPDAMPNLNPVLEADLELVSTVPGGALYLATGSDQTFRVLHVYGTPYEMGSAQGQLLGAIAGDFVSSVYDYVDSQVEEAIKGEKVLDWLPERVMYEIAEIGIDAALDLEFDATFLFTPDYFFEELHGLADSASVDYKKLRNIHLFGELTKGDCSLFGAWGDAVAAGHSLIQLRALDWDMDGPFRDYPQVTVYHPAEGYGHDFLTVGFSGFIGAFSGMSSTKMGMSQIGVYFSDASFGKESRFGIPFTYLIRDVLQWDNTIEDSVKRIQDAHRTCDLLLGVGDGKTDSFYGVKYSHSVSVFYNATDNEPVADWHPRIDDVVYYGMDWDCPGYDEVLGAQLIAAHGAITPELAIKNITSITQTGDLFVSYYDFESMTLYQSFAAPSTMNTTTPNAYDRTFLTLNATDLFAHPEPTMV